MEPSAKRQKICPCQELKLPQDAPHPNNGKDVPGYSSDDYSGEEFDAYYQSIEDLITNYELEKVVKVNFSLAKGSTYYFTLKVKNKDDAEQKSCICRAGVYVALAESLNLDELFEDPKFEKMTCVDEEDRKLLMLGGKAEYGAAPIELECTSSLKQSSWVPKTEEARACTFALWNSIHRGFKNVTVEGDCAFLITRIKKKEC
ncbi:hypothetical protein Cgig2_009947 [Carnegiea gigantea]|uniref:Uncharacterized protein n=1 Tax=Carnegiea gigantea TaxID=171969 RepID=A0A9Q1GZC9_9CARY|nr:hypothetical protein Cgig2_009947 [Carnegiea gigantea]